MSNSAPSVIPDLPALPRGRIRDPYYIDPRFRGNDKEKGRNDKKGFTRSRTNFREICGGRGFTLIELLVVISIIAILSVIGKIRLACRTKILVRSRR